MAAWIAETQAERRPAEQRDRAAPAKVTETRDRLSEDEIVALVEEFGDMVTVLRDAEPEHELDIYRNIGLRLTYDLKHERCWQISILPRTVGHRFVSEDRHRPMPNGQPPWLRLPDRPCPSRRHSASL